jgi:hypothetical protein
MSVIHVEAITWNIYSRLHYCVAQGQQICLGSVPCTQHEASSMSAWGLWLVPFSFNPSIPKRCFRIHWPCWIRSTKFPLPPLSCVLVLYWGLHMVRRSWMIVSPFWSSPTLSYVTFATHSHCWFSCHRWRFQSHLWNIIHALQLLFVLTPNCCHLEINLQTGSQGECRSASARIMDFGRPGTSVAVAHGCSAQLWPLGTLGICCLSENTVNDITTGI